MDSSSTAQFALAARALTREARRRGLMALFENRYRLQRLESDEPELTLEPIVAGAIPVP